MLTEWDQKVQALPPQRADEPLAEGIGLGTAHWGFEDPQPQMLHLLVQLLGEDTIPVMDQEPIAVVGWHRFS